jgi:hypothetical protein
MPCFVEGFFSPGKPLDWIVSMLLKVRTLFSDQVVGLFLRGRFSFFRQWNNSFYEEKVGE